MLHKHKIFPNNGPVFQIMTLIELPYNTSKTDPDCFVVATNALINLAAGTGEIM